MVLDKCVGNAREKRSFLIRSPRERVCRVGWGETLMPEDKAQTLMTGVGALLPLIVSQALNVIGAIVILLVGLWLAGKVHRWVAAALCRARHVDAMLKGFFGSVARYLVLTATLLAVLSQFGIQTTSLIAVIGAAGLAVGLALQGILSNLAAGIMLLIFRPFRVGHKVQVGGNTGIVRELTLFWTELVTDDKVLITVPNSGVWGQALRNFSVYPALHTGEARICIAEDTALDPALAKVRALVGEHPRVLANPPPSVLLDRDTTDKALEIVIGFSTAEDEIAGVKSDLIKGVHDGLRSEGAVPWRSRRRA
jgi:small conductance mechanosensitive channel